MNCTIYFDAIPIESFSHCITYEDAVKYATARYSQPVTVTHDKMSREEMNAVVLASVTDSED